jgi:hypothetical protein
MMTVAGDHPRMVSEHPSLFDILCGFLVAQRLDLNEPVQLAPGVTMIAADDDGPLVNCYLTYEPQADAPHPDLATLLRGARTDPARTAIVVPDHATSQVPELKKLTSGLARAVQPLSECLDAFLRPARICEELAGPYEIDGESHQFAKRGPSMFEQTLLNDKDWIPLNATVPHRGKVEAQRYLHTSWARGDSPRLCIVVAPAGHGKSKVTHILARRLAENYRSADYGQRPPLPILIPFGKYPRGTSSFDGLVLRFMDEFGVAKLTAEAFRYLVALGRVLFILDGYDEMVEASPDVAAENIAEFVGQAGPRSRILLTTRSTFYRTSSDVVGQIADPLLSEDEVEVIDLQPFDKKQAKEYVTRRLRDRPDRSRAMERAQLIIEREWNPDLLGSPIFLAEFVNLIEAGDWSTTDVAERGFLEYLIERTFARERTRQQHDFNDDQQRRYLENIAFDLLTTDVNGYVRDDLEIFAAEVADGEDQNQNWAALWRGLASHYFLLPDDDAAERPVATMRHQIWRDYFQGSSLGTRLNTGDTAAVHALTTRELPEGVLRTADTRITAKTWASLADRLRVDSNGDRLLRNMLRMALLRQPTEEGGLLRIPPEIARHLPGRDLSDTVFRNVRFDGSLAGCTLTACFFERCDLTRASFERALLNRTDFLECLMPANRFAGADVASLTIDGDSYFGPQLAARNAVEAGDGLAAASTANGPTAGDMRAWAKDILWARLAKFVKARGGDPYAILDSSISWNAFMGGTAPKDRDFVVRRLYKALRAENVVFSGPTGMSTRPVVLLGDDPEIRADVLALVRDGRVGPTIDRVIARLVK